jgi:hypothetical protein
VNIFLHFHYKNKTKKWNSNFTITNILCKFEQDLFKEVVSGLAGLTPDPSFPAPAHFV